MYAEDALDPASVCPLELTIISVTKLATEASFTDYTFSDTIIWIDDDYLPDTTVAGTVAEVLEVTFDVYFTETSVRKGRYYSLFMLGHCDRA